MNEDRPLDRDLTTADVAAAGETTPADRDALERDAADREVAISHEPGAADVRGDMQPLLPSDATEDFRQRWNDIQASFVDQPRKAVEQADGLVADAIKHLAQSFADARSRLERDWDRGDDVSTEDLRLTLQKYRAFFGRLLEV